MELQERENNGVPKEWLTDENPNHRFLAAKAIIMNDPTRREVAVGVLEELPNTTSLLGARVRRALAKFQLNVEDKLDILRKCSFRERFDFVTSELQKAVVSVGSVDSPEEADNWSLEKKRTYCESLLREFATYPRYRDRTSDAASILVHFGDVGLRVILDGTDDDDSEVRLVAVTCISELLLSHFQKLIVEIADLLGHWDERVSAHVPRMLWRSKAKFAIPKLEACLQHESSDFAALCAKAIAIIDPSKREESLQFVEGLEINAFYKSNLLAELRGEKPYLGL
ncbi:hypothetical protein [Fuerstiella marisgermanici]|uniref:HEAT repeat n=1 Tax=Fuerstiella marisgermanici TaxID=1891926 RepID=A0A1P8WH32_9PLAN|nr:hypothetical protein [Fuerstiella marisgermanici]APZ93358.1 HEAT repeat [Fuerstiella marisgermanici]